MSPRTLRSGILGLLSVVLGLWFMWGGQAAWSGMPLDDSWIHLVYARSIVETGLPYYNPGQLETGFSSPLWLAVLVPLVAIAGSVTQVVLLIKAAGIGISWGTSIAGAELARSVSGSERAGWIAGLAIALDPWLGFSRVAGMEVHLTAALITLTLLALFEDRPRLAALAAGLSVLARPECALLVALVVGCFATRERTRLRPDLWALMGLPTLGWVVFNLWSTGYPLPATYYAKAETGLLSTVHSFSEFMFAFWDSTWGMALGGVVLWYGGVLVLLDGVTEKSRWTQSLHWLLALFPLIWFAALCTSRITPDGDAFYWRRYLDPVLPVFLAVLAIGLDTGWRRGGRVAIGAWVMLGICVLRWPFAWSGQLERYAGNCEDIETLQVGIGHWLADNADPEDRFAALDAGAMRYFSGLPMLDLAGLNHSGVVHQSFEPFLDEWEPHWLVTSPSVPLELDTATWQLAHTVDATPYTICDCEGQEQMMVYERIGDGSGYRVRQ